MVMVVYMTGVTDLCHASGDGLWVVGTRVHVIIYREIKTSGNAQQVAHIEKEVPNGG